MNRAYLTLGSNIDPERNLPAASRALSGYGEVAAVSRVWESAPSDGSDQPDYLNAAVLLLTAMSADELQAVAVAGIERALGRVRDPADRNAPRTIDIDIALFNRDVLMLGHRHIPDPEIRRRAYVAVPLAELEPEYRHPETGETLERIAAGVSAGLRCRFDVELVAR